MCGILAVIGDTTLERFEQALDTMHHRGPDGRGIWTQRGLATLGHRRLSIRDIAGGSQPLLNEDETIVAAVNGEFYDYEQQRSLLEKRGHTFKTRSDSELVIHWYEEDRTGFLKQLRGEFAFLLWDRKRSILFAACDRFGIKPLVYARLGQGWAFASEAKALLELGVPRRLNIESVQSALTMQYSAPSETLFAGINRLPAAHALTVRGKELSISPYWTHQYPQETARVSDGHELAATIKTHLFDAVRSRFAADVPVGVYLSGGIDSAAVAGIAAHLGQPLRRAFTLSFESPLYDEYTRARAIGAALGIETQAVSVSSTDIIQALPDAVYYSEGLAINGHLSAKYLLSAAARKAGCPVILSGEGSDELLGGYPHHLADFQGGVASLLKHSPTSAGLMLPRGTALDTSAASAVLGFTPSFLQAKAGIGKRLYALLRHDVRCRWNPSRIMEAAFERLPQASELKHWHRVHRSMFAWTKLALSGYIIRTLGDGTEMAHSVEGRPPFLDHLLWEKVMPFAPQLLFNGPQQKTALREAMKGILPEAALTQQKLPLLAPPMQLCQRTPAGRLIRDLLFASLPCQLFDRAKVARWLSAIEQLKPGCRKPCDPVLFTMLSLSALCDRFGLEVAA